MARHFPLLGGRNDANSPLRIVAKYRGIFEESVALALRDKAPEALGAKENVIVEDTRRAFCDLERRAEELQSVGQDFTVQEFAEARALARRRAYVLPDNELHPEAVSKLDEIKEWGVPQSVLNELNKLLDDVKNKKSRPALNKLYEEHSYWDRYVDWYNRTSTTLGAGLGSLSVACLLIAILSVSRKDKYAVIACLLTGASGAMLSIMGKMPKMAIYGEATDLLRRQVIARIAAGTASSVLGIFLLSTGVVNIQIGDTPLPTLSRNCFDIVTTLESPSASPSGSASAGPAAPPPSPKDAGADAQEASPSPVAEADAGPDAQTEPATDKDAEAPLDAGADAQAEPHTAANQADAGPGRSGAGGAQNATSGKPENGEKPPGPCKRSDIFLLLALAFLFGFSERALVSFQEKILPSGNGNSPSPANPS